MININLLPWRKTRLHALKKQFNLCLLASVLTAIIGVISIQCRVMHLNQRQALLNQKLEHEQLHLDHQIKEIDEYIPESIDHD